MTVTMRETPATSRGLRWHRHFLRQAWLCAEMSKDPSTKTGCVVIDADRCIVSTGYNGFARGVNDKPDRYNDREVKYRFVVHCDTNAIYSAARRGVSLLGCTMYLTGPPCNECMKGIVQAGIHRVIWPEDNPFEKDPATQARWQGSIEASNAMAEEAGVQFLRIPE